MRPQPVPIVTQHSGKCWCHPETTLGSHSLPYPGPQLPGRMLWSLRLPYSEGRSPEAIIYRRALQGPCPLPQAQHQVSKLGLEPGCHLPNTSPLLTPLCRVKMLLASTLGWQQMHLFAECFRQKPGRPSHLPVKWDSYCLAGVPASSEHSSHGTQKPWDAPGRRWRPLGLHPVSSQVLDRMPQEGA